MPDALGITKTLFRMPVKAGRIAKINSMPINPRRQGVGQLAKLDFNDLIESMRDKGQLDPIQVIHGEKIGLPVETYAILDGDRRWNAAQKLEWSEVDAILWEGEFDLDFVLEFMLISDVRQPLRPSSVALTINKMILQEPGRWNAVTLGSMLGKRPHEIDVLLTLAAADQTVLRKVDAYYATDGKEGFSLTAFKAISNRPKAVQKQIVAAVDAAGDVDEDGASVEGKAVTVAAVKRAMREVTGDKPQQSSLGVIENSLVNLPEPIMLLNKTLAWLGDPANTDTLSDLDRTKLQTLSDRLALLVS